MNGPPVWALGLMSGTSMDGVDAALIKTDGRSVAEVGPFLTLPYERKTRARLAAAVAGNADGRAVRALEREITDHHRRAVLRLLDLWHDTAGVGTSPAVIGFHGHTLWHRPESHATRQIGDGVRLAELTGLPVVNDFRSNDMAAGGQGAPFAPLYHAARLTASTVEYPVCILNLGGVANVTWIGGPGAGLDHGKEEILAFDTGPASAYIDDWVRAEAGMHFDEDGKLAAEGRADEAVLDALLNHPYFDAPPPKSLDRAGFDVSPVSVLGPADGAATLTAFSARAVGRALRFLPRPPACWFATGGGRHNRTLMAALGAALGMEVRRVEDLGWNGDALEAEAFAFLAVRSFRGLPLSLPQTTGASRAVTGGTLHRPE
ncbi:MAG TPA: anhydro-N-acetylmuramic acid kinase [Alphaproteobacteria bacterium]|nr:anhydro-N-acetylmuramic acid kinase [Alphaproteobacteria bacterium]